MGQQGQQRFVRECESTDVVSQGIRIVRTDNRGARRAFPLIEKNTPLPVEHTESFGTVVDNQQLVELDLLEGDSEDPEDCVVLGKGMLQLPPGLPRGSEIQVTYRIEQDIILQITAVEQVHGGQCTCKIERKGAMMGQQDKPGLLQEYEAAGVVSQIRASG